MARRRSSESVEVGLGDLLRKLLPAYLVTRQGRRHHAPKLEAQADALEELLNRLFFCTIEVCADARVLKRLHRETGSDPAAFVSEATKLLGDKVSIGRVRSSVVKE